LVDLVIREIDGIHDARGDDADAVEGRARHDEEKLFLAFSGRADGEDFGKLDEAQGGIVVFAQAFHRADAFDVFG
jgi:hypothetical protein